MTSARIKTTYFLNNSRQAVVGNYKLCYRHSNFQRCDRQKYSMALPTIAIAGKNVLSDYAVKEYKPCRLAVFFRFSLLVSNGDHCLYQYIWPCETYQEVEATLSSRLGCGIFFRRNNRQLQACLSVGGGVQWVQVWEVLGLRANQIEYLYSCSPFMSMPFR